MLGWIHLLPLLKSLLGQFTYFGLAMILVAGGLGVPIPEDVPLMFSGYLSNPTQSPLPVHTNVMLMITAGMLGVICGDSVLWYVGRYGIDADNFLARHIRKALGSKRRTGLERHFYKHGNITLFVGRFIPGIRAIIFALCGVSKMPYIRFVIVDGLAALVSVPTFILIGYHFARDFNVVVHEFEKIKHIVILVGLSVALIAGVVYLIRRRIKTRSPDAKIKEPSPIQPGA